jgi:hypothetical protein
LHIEPTIKADLYSAGKILWSMITNRPAFDREQPVFNDKSLAKALRDVRMSWHFHHIDPPGLAIRSGRSCRIADLLAG